MAGSPSRSIPRAASAPARKGKSAAARRAKPSLLGRVIARPGVIVAGATFAAVMTGIVLNALVFQKGHHPSPLFGPAQTSSVEPTRLVTPAPVPVPVPRPVLDEPKAPVPQLVAPAPATAPSMPTPLHPAHAASKPVKHTSVPVHKPAVAPAHKDPIGQLIGKAQ